MSDGKNRMNELLDSLGHPRDLCLYEGQMLGAGGPWSATACLVVPGCPEVRGTGRGLRLRAAQAAAADIVLANLDAGVRRAADWRSIRVEAQAGDALLKLAAYLESPEATPAAHSLWLQTNEANVKLALLFDAWRGAGAPELAVYGTGLGRDLKATVVEAVLWRRFGRRILDIAARGAFEEMRRLVTMTGAPPHHLDHPPAAAQSEKT